VGTFELVQQPPHYDVVDKVILPPTFSVQWHEGTELPDHQLNFMGIHASSQEDMLRADLGAFGQKLNNLVKNEPFHWNGLGEISRSGNGYRVQNNMMNVHGLSAVKAHKVIREKASHHMVVGDRETTTGKMTESLKPKAAKRSLLVILAWIVLLLLIAAIVYILIANDFNPLSTGLRFPAAPANPE
jgi:hypothetical protein